MQRARMLVEYWLEVSIKEMPVLSSSPGTCSSTTLSHPPHLPSPTMPCLHHTHMHPAPGLMPFPDFLAGPGRQAAPRVGCRAMHSEASRGAGQQ